MLIYVIGALVALCALHLLLTFALIRRVRTLQDMLSGPDQQMLAVGTPIDTFEASTPRGDTLTDAALRDTSVVVGFFRAGCGPCERMRGALVDAPPAIPVIAFVAGTEQDPAARELLSSLGQVARVAYVNERDPVHRVFAPPAFPSFYRVDNGVVRATGHQLTDVVP